MNNNTDSTNRRLAQELAVVIVVKLAILAALWMAFFRPDGQAVARLAALPAAPTGEDHGR